MAEKTWEGRGDKLQEMRLTILPGPIADDLRLTGAHMRLLLHIGRQNHRRGWLRLSQKELAEAWGISRQRINSAIGELVTWGYVIKRDQKEAGESFCTYKVRLDGEDDDETDAGGVSTTGDTPGQSAARGECKVQATPPVSPPGDTRVNSMTTPVSPGGDTPHSIHARAPTNADRRRRTPPRSPCDPGQDVCASGGKPLDDLRAQGIALHVVENLIAPLLGVLAFERRRDPAAVPLALLQGIRDACAEFSPRALSEAARALRDTRTEWPSTAIAKRTAQEAQARTMIRIAPGTPQWDAWIEHWKASGKPFLVRTYEQEGSARVPTEFPPAADPVKSTADKYITVDGRKPGAAA